MFVPLYQTTEYSILQSACTIEAIMQAANQNNYRFIAITDSNMHGVIKFYQSAIKNNLKPIIGLKIKYRMQNQDDFLLLYAMDNEGYFNLINLASKLKAQGGCLDIEDLETHKQGLIALTPGSESWLNQAFLRNIKLAQKAWEVLSHIYAHIYFGITLNVFEESSWPSLKSIISNLGIKMVAIHNSLFMERSDQEVLAALHAIQRSYYEENDNFIDDERYFHYHDYLERFNGEDELLANTLAIANLCDVKLSFNQIHMPQFSPGLDADITLKILCEEGLKLRLRNINLPHHHYYERLETELATIKAMGFSDYFLIVGDFIKYAKDRDIYVGPGRGSAPASLVSYALGITEIDPIKYGLLFERFLNRERITMPDIDIDFPDDKREEIIQYVKNKYGVNRVAHIVTFGTFALKSSIRDVARIYKLPLNRLNEIMKATEGHEQNLKGLITSSARLQSLINDYPDIARVLKIASKIEGLPRNTSVHAAGIIITKNDLVNYTPASIGASGIMETQYEASDLEELGLLKMDFLGLRNLTNIKKAIDLIKTYDQSFLMPKVYNDAKTFALIAKGDTNGIFQLESSGMKKLLKELKVKNFDDLALAIALYRPGPMDMIPLLIKRKNRKVKIEYPHEDLTSILAPTYGTLVYQEQILLIARKFASYSYGQADVLRRGISKKDKDILEKERIPFIDATIKNGYLKRIAEEIYDYILKFASYGFNKAHSVAYAVIAYETAYLKANYPNYYLSILMNSVIGSGAALTNYRSELNRYGYKILPPNINLSTEVFLIHQKTIIYPLTGISGIGLERVNQLIEERKKGIFFDFENFIRRTYELLTITQIENIIYSGALDALHLTKKAMIENINHILEKIQYPFVANLIKKTYDNEEYPFEVLLEKEKAVLSINIQYDVFNQYTKYLNDKKYCSIAKLKTSGNVRIFGIIQELKVITTKKNEQMAFGAIKDNTGMVEMTIFPKVYANYLDIKVNQAVDIDGYLEERNDKLQLVVEYIRKI